MCNITPIALTNFLNCQLAIHRYLSHGKLVIIFKACDIISRVFKCVSYDVNNIKCVLILRRPVNISKGSNPYSLYNCISNRIFCHIFEYYSLYIINSVCNNIYNTMKSFLCKNKVFRTKIQILTVLLT